jgi:hypothetical protein
MEKIKYYSGLLQKMFYFLTLAYPTFILLFWGSYGYMPPAWQQGVAPINLNSITWNTKTLICVELVLLPGALLSGWMLFSLSRLFNNYTKGQIFIRKNCALIHRMAKILLAGVIVDIATTTALAWAFSFQSAPGQRILQITISNRQIEWLIVAAILWVLSKVQEEAANLSEDSILTV